jgi:hypothetical protein
MSGFAEGTPTVSVSLGGKSYTLGWTWAAKRRVRDYLTSIGKDGAGVHEEEYLSAVLWASMEKDARTDLSVDDVAELINPSNETEIAEKIRRLCIASEPESDPNVEPAAAKMEEPTAGRSLSSSAGQLVSTT